MTIVNGFCCLSKRQTTHQSITSAWRMTKSCNLSQTGCHFNAFSWKTTIIVEIFILTLNAVRNSIDQKLLCDDIYYWSTNILLDQRIRRLLFSIINIEYSLEFFGWRSFRTKICRFTVKVKRVFEIFPKSKWSSVLSSNDRPWFCLVMKISRLLLLLSQHSN